MCSKFSCVCSSLDRCARTCTHLRGNIAGEGSTKCMRCNRGRGKSKKIMIYCVCNNYMDGPLNCNIQAPIYVVFIFSGNYVALLVSDNYVKFLVNDNYVVFITSNDNYAPFRNIEGNLHSCMQLRQLNQTPNFIRKRSN